MKSVTTLIPLNEGIWRTIWIIDPIVECFEVFLVSRVFQVSNILLKSLSIGISHSMATLLVKVMLLLFDGFRSNCWENINCTRMGGKSVNFLVHLCFSNILGVLLS